MTDKSAPAAPAETAAEIKRMARCASTPEDWSVFDRRVDRLSAAAPVAPVASVHYRIDANTGERKLCATLYANQTLEPGTELYAAPAVPVEPAAPTEAMVLAAARALCKESAKTCNTDEQDLWKFYGDTFKDDARAALRAALSSTPAAPAVLLTDAQPLGASASPTACSVASLPEPEVSALRVPPAGADFPIPSARELMNPDDLMRAQFEANVRGPLKRHFIYTDQYEDYRVNDAWSLWQKCVEIEREGRMRRSSARGMEAEGRDPKGLDAEGTTARSPTGDAPNTNGGTKEGATPASAALDWRRITELVNDCVRDYELDCGDGIYVPNENERLLLLDCINGLLADPEFVALMADASAVPALEHIRDKLEIMLGSAVVHGDGEWVTGYTIKTGALHAIIGILQGAGLPVAVPLASRNPDPLDAAVAQVKAVVREQAQAAENLRDVPLLAAAPSAPVAPGVAQDMARQINRLESELLYGRRDERFTALCEALKTHGGDSDGWEFGLGRVRFVNGQPAEFLWATQEDIDAAVRAAMSR